MIYPDNFESKIGFDKVRDGISRLCVGMLGRNEVHQMKFSADFYKINTALHETSELLSILNSHLNISISDGAPNLDALNEMKSEGSFVNPLRYLGLVSLVAETSEVKKLLCSKSESDDSDNVDRKVTWPFLASVAENLSDTPEIVNEINRTINKFGEVKDTASDKLFELRSQLRAMAGQQSKTMKRVLDAAVSAGILSKDTAPSIRDGRMVIPVDAANKRSISGIVHDASATGKTVFIEPIEVIEVSNKIKEIEMEAHREEVIILKALASEIRPNIPVLKRNLRILAHLDFVKAKALFARETGANLPHLNQKCNLEWYGARHPHLLLTLREHGKEVVPLNITLNNENRILIISGPNAGGKSVVLKTVGCVQYMMQCGVLPTLYENSHMGVFDNLYVDIGDEQSLENDLSTYSSHLKNMKYFLRHSSSRTLLLADEMGSGTEPTIGGALAQAILKKLAASRCKGIITTHFQNLKTFASETDGFANGAMLYDRQHLQPTFELAVGQPGSSFAIEIARKIGLDGDVIASAQEIVGSDYVNLDKYLLDVARDRRYWAMKRQSIKEKEAKFDQLLERYEDKTDDLKARRNAILHDAKQEAKEIVNTANAKIEKVIRDIRNANAEKEATKKIRSEFDTYKSSVASDDLSGNDTLPEALREQKHQSRQKKARQLNRVQSPSAKMPKGDFGVGDFVKMKDGNVAGQILRIEGKRAEVGFGALKAMVELSNLMPSAKPKETARTESSGLSRATVESSRQRQLNFKTDIDVRGMRGDEAVQAIMYFLDDAVQFSAKRLRILHGTGSGILKTLIRQQLKAHPLVAHFQDEDVRFGGAGITLVDLDV